MAVGTKLYFKGSYPTLQLDNTATISLHPTSARTLYLNLDNFITLGTAS